MKFPPITTARLEYVPPFRSYLLSFFLFPFPPPSLRNEVFYRLPHAHMAAHGRTRINGSEKMSRNVFESIPFANYLALIQENRKIFKYFGLRKEFYLKVFKCGDRCHVCENSVHLAIFYDILYKDNIVIFFSNSSE